MKKLSLLATVLAFTILLCSCGAPAQNTNPAIEKQLYESINTLYGVADAKMQYILLAWDFSIKNNYNSGRFHNGYWKDFAERLGISQEEMKEVGLKVMSPLLPDLNWEYIVNDDKAFSVYIQGVSTSISIAKYVVDKTFPSSVDNLIDDVQTSIKNLEGRSESYSIFKDYYIMILEMFDWLDSPQGTYMSVKSSLDEYSKKSSEYQRQLLFIIE